MFSARIPSKSIGILLFLDILCSTQFYLIQGIPINLQTNKNNYNENHANRPLLPNQPPSQQLRPPLTQKQAQQPVAGLNPNINPEIEDFGRLNTNQNQFRRHAITPPDAKVTPGAFQSTPPEQYGQNGGNNLHQRFEESLPNPMFRHQPPQDNRQQPQGLPASVLRQRRHSQDIPPPHFSGSPRAETHFNHAQSFDSFHTQTNEILRERNGPSNYYDNRNSFQQQVKPFPLGQQPQPVDVFANREGSMSSNSHIGFNIPPRQPPLTAIALVIQGLDGNSTLFIEYDVSDNDVTYETTVEVEDGGEF
ncbi:unnamed protein product [Orchesella dallaii]|uniref:Uncharacterized protein n=1 Tax=Orchesella dallaii TaxID=48710 RepID=A0ABP1QUK8_9HEXA